jgi:type I restriction enzyme S subunit
MTFELPDGWKLVTVSELAGLGGLVADGDWIESKDQDPDGDVRLIQLADIGVGEFLNRSERFLTSHKARELQCTMLDTGDLLVARMPDPLGRACLFPGVGQPSVTAVDVFIWRPGKNAANTRWLMHAINSPQVRESI